MAAPFAVENFLIPVEQERVRAYGSPAAAVRIVFLASFLQFVVDPLSRNNDIFQEKRPSLHILFNSNLLLSNIHLKRVAEKWTVGNCKNQRLKSGKLPFLIFLNSCQKA